jgi:hypothetical protein
MIAASSNPPLAQSTNEPSFSTPTVLDQQGHPGTQQRQLGQFDQLIS